MTDYLKAFMEGYGCCALVFATVQVILHVFLK